jgi:AcrR family transcriptional regulator
MKKPGSVHSSSFKHRQRIIKASLKCFVESGFSEASMHDICRRSGTSCGSIYHHYGSKEQLAAAVLCEGLKDHQSGLLAELNRHTDARAGVFAAVGYYLKWVRDNPEWARFIFQMRQAEFISSAEEEIKERNRATFEQFHRWLKPHVESGVIKKMPKELYLALVMGPCHLFAQTWLSGGGRRHLPRIKKALSESIWQSLKAREEGGP